MGADIHGWVEIRAPGRWGWNAAIAIHDIVYRQYGMFASLFGARNHGEGATENGRFRAIAAWRGVPAGTSVLYDLEHDSGVGETWVLWSELAAIDWNEEGSEYIDDNGLVSVHPGHAGGARAW